MDEVSAWEHSLSAGDDQAAAVDLDAVGLKGRVNAEGHLIALIKVSQWNQKARPV